MTVDKDLRKLTVDKDLRKSAKDFKLVVWPKVKHWFGEGDLTPVEAVTESGMAQMLDMYSGIDAWYIEKETGIRGIGSRVQWGKKRWNTFTIRKKRDSGTRTEYAKLINAIENDWLYPYWFIQAYINNGELLTAGLAKTSDIINYIKTNPSCPTRLAPNAVFYYVDWIKFEENYFINTYPEKEKQIIENKLTSYFGGS